MTHVKSDTTIDRSVIHALSEISFLFRIVLRSCSRVEKRASRQGSREAAPLSCSRYGSSTPILLFMPTGLSFMQMGFQIPNPDDGGADDDDGDDDLEAELLRLQQDSGGSASRRTKGNQQASVGGKPNLQAFHNDVNKLLRDIDQPINDDDLSDVDEDDLLVRDTLGSV